MSLTKFDSDGTSYIQPIDPIQAQADLNSSNIDSKKSTQRESDISLLKNKALTDPTFAALIRILGI